MIIAIAIAIALAKSIADIVMVRALVMAAMAMVISIAIVAIIADIVMGMALAMAIIVVVAKAMVLTICNAGNAHVITNVIEICSNGYGSSCSSEVGMIMSAILTF